MTTATALPTIFQGGMGAGISDWRLARAVSSAGGLGIVSGTALDLILARRLQDGDPEGHVRRALEHFPFPEVAEDILGRYYIAGGKSPKNPFLGKPVIGNRPGRHLARLIVAANFVEVHLARESHDNPVGINYLEKIQSPILPSLYGALLAGVDAVVVGAGIPLAIPGAIDQLCRHEDTSIPLNVSGTTTQEHRLRFSPREIFHGPPPALKRPLFLPIISSLTMARLMHERASGPIDGVIVELPSAGGHNAPPRGKLRLDDRGEPIYGDRDTMDFGALRELNLPFWIGGSHGSPEKLKEALALGASGIQVGTLFAFCRESGLREDLKSRVLQHCRNGSLHVRTDARASPTGFPFKVLDLEGTLSDPAVVQERPRRCDLGYLRSAYEKPDQSLGWRCPSEDVRHYTEKGGHPDETEGRVCLCNGLMANIGLGQISKDGISEPALVTAGDHVEHLCAILQMTGDRYAAGDALAYLSGEPAHAS